MQVEKEKEKRDIASADAVLYYTIRLFVACGLQDNSGDSHTLPVSIVTVPNLGEHEPNTQTKIHWDPRD